MTIRIRETTRGTTIRFTGADASRALGEIAAALEAKGAADAQKPVPNRPKANAGAPGAETPHSVSVAFKSRRP
ncbi:hypothetical protein [Acidovorax sp. NCPPB 3576]|uniref:hypothetical protein n=1 Tax=Acidovorax sp. NCPPB 3576 TaxID=2940488 RepID=UPI00234B8CF2|nr:hypothetical protein [Acidovorax sp. NCPPB 3576]WCM88531.1 hypothetical protein M5C98_00245 [Acidovorax sp. NCPPB 3576]